MPNLFVRHLKIRMNWQLNHLIIHQELPLAQHQDHPRDHRQGHPRDHLRGRPPDQDRHHEPHQPHQRNKRPNPDLNLSTQDRKERSSGGRHPTI